jgi:hypothetical protein
VADLAIHQCAWDYTGNFSARRQHGIRNNAHQTNMAAAVYQRHTASRNLLSECSRRVGIGGIMAGG